MSTTETKLLTTVEAAQVLRASLPTLARWRGTGQGPVYIKRGGHVFYSEDSIESFLKGSERQSTRPSK